MKHTPKDASYSLRLPSKTLDKLREIETRVGVPVAEQIRRGVALWLETQESDTPTTAAKKARHARALMDRAVKLGTF